MKMDEVITRINVLAKKAKAEGLTPEELTERDKLRRIYIDSVKATLKNHRSGSAQRQGAGPPVPTSATP